MKIPACFFYTDFNDPTNMFFVHWWEVSPEVDEYVVLYDGDLDVTLARVTKIGELPDREKRVRGWCEAELVPNTWVDGSTVARIAMQWVQQPTRNIPAAVDW